MREQGEKQENNLMVIIITGASHTGKTFLAQKLLEKYKMTYLSVDHLKMGLIRSGQTALTVYDDEKLTAYLWPIVREIIKTVIENRQNLIVEGCYIPLDYKKYFSENYLAHIKFVCLVFSDNYIENHFEDIKKYSCITENRKKDRYSIKQAKKENKKYLDGCKKHGLNYILSDKEYCAEFNPFKVWESERLEFIRISDSDFNELCEMLKDPLVMHFWEHVFTDEEVYEWINRRKEGYRKYGYDYFLAKDKITGNIVGQIGLLEENINGKNFACLGYMLKKKYMHMGYAREGAEAMLKYAFTELKKTAVKATIRPENLSSVNVALSLGMKKISSMIKIYKGKEMPHDVYVIRDKTWFSKNI